MWTGWNEMMNGSVNIPDHGHKLVDCLDGEQEFLGAGAREMQGVSKYNFSNFLPSKQLGISNTEF